MWNLTLIKKEFEHVFGTEWYLEKNVFSSIYIFLIFIHRLGIEKYIFPSIRY